MAEWLQAAGVAAYPVLDTEGLLVDPQLRHRRWYQVRPSARFDRDVFGGVPQRLEGTPGDIDSAGPVLGGDTEAVLRDVAGLSGDEVDALMASRAAFRPAQPDLVLRRPYDPYLPILLPEGEVRA